VSIFRSVARTDHVNVALSDLNRGFLSRQIRVYVRANESFRLGRVTRYFLRDDGFVEYEVRFPNGARQTFRKSNSTFVLGTRRTIQPRYSPPVALKANSLMTGAMLPSRF
jgi:hypothetical protein